MKYPDKFYLLTFVFALLVINEGRAADLILDDGVNITVIHGVVTTVPVSFNGDIDGIALSLTVHLDSNQSVTINGTVSSKSGEIVIVPNNLASVPYGSYSATVLLEDVDIQYKEEAYLNYEEDITGLTVVNNEGLIGRDVTISVNILTGSNVQVKWMIDQSTSTLQYYPGVVRSVYFTTIFDVAMTYTVDVIVENSLKREEAITFPVVIKKSVENFNVRLENNTVVAVGKICFTTYVDSNTTLPIPTSYFNLFMNNDLILNKSLDNEYALLNDGMTLSHEMQTVGIFTFEAIIHTTFPSDRVNFIFNIEVLPLITGFQIKGHNWVKLDYSLNFKERVYFVYSTGNDVSVSAKLYTDPIKMINSVLDTRYQSGCVLLNKDALPDLPLGIFRLEIMLTSRSGETQSQDVAVFHDEPITDFQSIQNETLFLTNREVPFPTIFSGGSSQQIEFIIDSIESAIELTAGEIRNYTVNHVFTAPSSYSITPLARNSLNSAFIDSFTIILVYPVSGFLVDILSNPIDSYSNMTFVARLDSISRLPMGTVDMIVDFGDGQNITIEINDKFDTLLSPNGYTFTHFYSNQGDRIITILFKSELSTQEIVLTAMVWDDISNLNLVSVTAARVNEVVNFYFTNFKSSGFDYDISYGDDTVIRSDPDSLSRVYSESTKYHSYNAPNVYDVILTASNKYYSKRFTYKITVQYPVPSLSLSPQPPYMIPLPNGRIHLTMEMDSPNPSPTDVYCLFSYEMTKLPVTESVDIVYGNPILRTNDYITNGTKFVNFTCFNLVSSVTVTTIIYTQLVTVDDYIIRYPPVVPMNMTPDVNHVPVNVDFSVHVYECVRFHPGVRFTWDFGDGSSTMTTSNKFHNHVYEQRGSYNITFTIADEANQAIKVFPIKIGAVDFAVDKYVGDVGQAIFRYTMSNIGVSGTYDLTLSETETEHYEQTEQDAVFTHDHVYGYYVREFKPFIVAKNVDFTEKLYYDDSLKVDFRMHDVVISVTRKTMFPPGKVTVTIGLKARWSTALPYVTCIFDMGDYIDYSIYQRMQNISFEKPLLFHYEYKVLGNLTANVTCFNYFESVTKLHTVESYNDCFTVNGIFDRQYSNISHPMKVYTSVDYDLASRMAVNCVDQLVEFKWTLYTFNVNKTKQVYEYDPVVTHRGILRFPKGSIPENIYLVTLNVSLLGLTWIYEPTFVQFINSPPFAYIEGGNERYGKIWRNKTTLDAFTSSYDVSRGYGGNKNLKYEWSCIKILANDLRDLTRKYKESTNYEDSCTLDSENDGQAVLIFDQKNTIGYAVTVNVTLTNTSNPLSSSFTQLIMGTDSKAPEIEISCRLNCGKKYATMSRSIMRAVCIDCTEYNVTSTELQYQWYLSLYDNVTKSFTIDSTFASKTNTGISGEELVISQNQLKPDKIYQVGVIVNRIGEPDSAEVSSVLTTKRPPFGGSCRASNRSATGRAADLINFPADVIPQGTSCDSLFAILCTGWKNDIVDSELLKTKPPLLYEYLMSLNKTDKNGNHYVETTVMYKGGLYNMCGESTASELRFPTGVAANDYLIDITVNIYDVFGDYSSVKLHIQVLPSNDVSLKGETDLDATIKLIKKWGDNYDMTDAGGNDNAVFRLVKAVAGYFLPISFMNSTAKADTSSLDKAILFNDTVNDIQTMLQEMAFNIASNITSKVPENSTLFILPADIRLIAKSLETTIANVDLMTAYSSAEAFIAVANLMENVQAFTNIIPFPMTEFQNVLEATSDVVGVISTNLEFLETAGEENLDVVYTKEMVTEELEEYYRYHAEGIDGYPSITNELIEIMWEKKQQIRCRKNNIASSVRNSTLKMLFALDYAFNITAVTSALGEGEVVIQKPNLNVSVEKDTIQSFMNKSEVVRGGFVLDLSNGTFDNITATEMDLQVSVLKNSPFLHVKKDYQIRSSVLGITTFDGNGKKIEIPFTLRVQNEAVANAIEYTATGVDKMQFISPYKDSNDAILLYIRPEGFDDTTIDGYEVTVTISSQTPTGSEFSEKLLPTSWTIYGFKVFVASGTLEAGTILVSLTFDEVLPEADPETPTRRKRSIVEGRLNTTLLSNVSISIVTTGCRSYNPDTESWNPNSCSVLSFSTINETVCRCPPGSGRFFASSFWTPNIIDFHAVFDQFDASNAAVYATMICIFVLYAFAVIHARRKDQRDVFQWMPVFLYDNKVGDEYFYLITVYTGMRPQSGTKSNVFFILSSDEMDSELRILSDGNSQEFETGSVKTFLMSTSGCLGTLSYIRIWHDNSGDGKFCSWYLNKIVVRDLQTGDNNIFLCNNWLSQDIGDGIVDRILPALSNSDYELDVLVAEHARDKMTDNHIWLSLVVRHQSNAFTRVQRLSCALTILFLIMASNAMFFTPEDEKVISSDTVRIGIFRLSLKSAYVSVVGAVITVVPVFIITHLFKNRHTKSVSKNKSKTNLNKMELYRPDDNRYKHRQGKRIRPQVKFTTKGKLPYWVLYIAWGILTMAVVTSVFFLLLYSMQWGKKTSEEWLTTFVISFFESVLVVDPVKVLILAAMVAIVTRRPVENDTIDVDIESVKLASFKKRDETIAEIQIFLEMQMAVMTTDNHDRSELHSRRLMLRKERTAKRAFLKLLLQFLFTALVVVIGYLSRDQLSYSLKANVANQLYVSSKNQFGFDQVTSYETFYKWVNQTLLTSYFPTSSYNGGTISIRDKHFISDMTNLRLGLIRIRQLRVKKDKCFSEIIAHDQFCSRKYSKSSESEDSYCKECSLSWTADDWHFISAEEISGTDLVGKYNSYGGGGYICNLDNDVDRAKKIIEEGIANSWIDRLTRAVIVEFSLYNANVNLMAYVVCMAEFMETGGVITWFDVQSFRPSRLVDATGVTTILCLLILAVIVFIITIGLLNEIRKEKLKALQNFWNCVDVLMCAIGFAVIIVWACKFTITRNILKLYYKDKSKFINFQHIVIWEYMHNCMLGVLTFISFIRLLKVLGYNKRLTQIATVLTVGYRDMIQFFVVFMFAFSGFVLFGYLVFGGTVYEWRNLFVSFGSLVNTLIGRNSFNKLVSAVPNFTEVYFFVYVFFIIFTLMTIFLAILNEAINVVKNSPEVNKPTLGVTDIVKGSIRDFLQLLGIFIWKKNGKRQPNFRFPGTNDVNTTNMLGIVRNTFTGFEMDTEKNHETNSKESTRTDLSSMSLYKLKLSDVVLESEKEKCARIYDGVFTDLK